LIIRSTSEFHRHYRGLGPRDLVLGLLSLKLGEEAKLLDLTDRRVTLFPPALAQLLNRSKAAQAEVLGAFMIPGTFVAYGPADLAARLPDYPTPAPLVSKRDRAHLGLGVSLWPSLELLFTLAGVREVPYPLVVQPFLAEARDFRVVMVGDYAEAYERVNPGSFRKNLFQGGSSQPAEVTPAMADFCGRVMARGRFPYAVLDLLLSPAGDLYLSEISLKGGLKGSRIGQEGFRTQVRSLQDDFLRQWESSLKTPA